MRDGGEGYRGDVRTNEVALTFDRLRHANERGDEKDVVRERGKERQNEPLSVSFKEARRQRHREQRVRSSVELLGAW